MDGATYAALKEFKRLLRFVVDTKDFGWKVETLIKDRKTWNIVVYSDIDWAGDKEIRRSVSGYIIYLLGVPIFWKSKLQRSVSLSSAVAEYYALSEEAKEIKFLLQILKSLGVEMEFPIIIYIDNVGAIFMSVNIAATSRTRHVDATNVPFC
jgi:hypothetical protein